MVSQWWKKYGAHLKMEIYVPKSAYLLLINNSQRRLKCLLRPSHAFNPSGHDGVLIALW
jgi:hypothetical protein